MLATQTAWAGNHCARNRAQSYPWHGQYYHAAWGKPVALVVPPTAEVRTNWSWGVGGTRIHTIHHQFDFPYAGPGVYEAGSFHPTPPWPSDTRQFGVYYIRGPW
jgi:hypothetical protein